MKSINGIEIEVGQLVIYVPNHVKEAVLDYDYKWLKKRHEDLEYGIVTSIGIEGSVFVKYITPIGVWNGTAHNTKADDIIVIIMPDNHPVNTMEVGHFIQRGF